jgi:hypothetical protein
MRRGQSLVEMTVILPVLLILMIGVAEMGFGLRNYLAVVNANREGARYAAKGQKHEDYGEVFERIKSATGAIGDLDGDGEQETFLRTTEVEPNTGIIITDLRLSSEGQIVSSAVVTYTGKIPDGAGGLRDIGSDDSRVSPAGILTQHGQKTLHIGQTREAELGVGMALDNRIYVVEVFFAHQPLMISSLVPLPEPWPMYARTVMRVTTAKSGS